MSSYDEFPQVRPVRPYVVTGGRARPTRNTIRPETLLIAVPSGKELPVTASSEERVLLRMCHQLLSLVEAAAHIRLPVSVTGVVASDLVDAGFLAMRLSDELPSGADRPRADGSHPARPSRELLQEVLNGLGKLT
jgi:hypothetical protein